MDINDIISYQEQVRNPVTIVMFPGSDLFLVLIRKRENKFWFSHEEGMDYICHKCYIMTKISMLNESLLRFYPARCFLGSGQYCVDCRDQARTMRPFGQYQCKHCQSVPSARTFPPFFKSNMNEE